MPAIELIARSELDGLQGEMVTATGIASNEFSKFEPTGRAWLEMREHGRVAVSAADMAVWPESVLECLVRVKGTLHIERGGTALVNGNAIPRHGYEWLVIVQDATWEVVEPR